jgi:hypothetical protein
VGREEFRKERGKGKMEKGKWKGEFNLHLPLSIFPLPYVVTGLPKK